MENEDPKQRDLARLADLQQKSLESRGSNYAHLFSSERIAVDGIVFGAAFATGHGVLELHPDMDDAALAAVVRLALKASGTAGFRVVVG